MNLNEALKSTSSLWLVQVIKMAMSFVVSIITIRYLGPEQYGTLATGSALVILFSALVSLPQGSLIVRELSKEEERNFSQVISTAFNLRILGFLCQLALSATAVYLIGYSSNISLIVLLTALSYLASPFAILISTLEFNGEFNKKAKIEFLIALSAMSINLLLVFFEAPLLWFAASSLINSIISIIIYLLLIPGRKYIAPVKSITRERFFLFLKEGWPLVLVGMAIAVYTRTDILFITYLLDERQAGWYTAGIRFAEILYFFPGVIANIYFPTIAKRKLDDKEAYYRIVTNSCSAAFGLGLCIALALAIFAPFGLPVLLGDNFLQSILIVQISAWTIAIVGLSGAFSSAFIIDHATRIPLYSTLVGAACNVILNSFLIPAFGITGAIIATLISQMINLLTMVLLAKDKRLVAVILRAISPSYSISIGLTIYRVMLKSVKNYVTEK